MKKLSVLFLTGVMCLSLVACGGGDGGGNTTPTNTDSPATSNENKKDVTALVLGETYSVENYADITLIGIEATKKVTASMAGGMYYEKDEADKTYIDVVFDVTNTNAEAINSEDLMVATATSAGGAEYECSLYVVEVDDMTGVSSYEKIDPLSTVRFHAAISVPVSESTFTLAFNLNDSKFSVDFSADTVMKNTIALNVGDVIGNEDYATLEFVGVDFAERIDPSNTNGGYSYIEVKNSDNTYMVLEFKITNYQSNEKDIDTFVGAKATFMGKYKYSGRVVSEDSDQKGVSSYNDIAPLETARVFVLIEVPKAVMDKEYDAEVFFDKQFYSVNG